MALRRSGLLAALCSGRGVLLVRWALVALGLGAGLVGSGVPLARAQSSVSLSGRWQADPMTVRWVIGDWGDACGPRPSGGGDTGGVVEIEVKGAELVISSPERSYSTAQCWALHPELERQSHAAGGRSWATTCRTDANDARQEVLQTNITATDDTISFRESGQYQFALQGQTCSASSGRWRTYRRLAEGSEPLPATGPATAPPPLELVPEPREVPPPELREVPPPELREVPPPELREVPPPPPPRRPATANPCLKPGPPARIDVRPARKLMRAGESFLFRAVVFDVRGCALRTPVSWALSPPGAAAQLEEGVLEIPAGAADAQLGVVATAAHQSVRVSVEVVSSDRYSALLASGNFTADGASIEAATATITEGSLGAQSAATEGEAPGRKWTFVALVSAIALSFGVLGAFLLTRANRQRRAAAPRAATVDVGTVVFSGEGQRAPPAAPTGDATRFEPLSHPAPVVAPVVSAAMVCPICGTLYPTQELKTCPKDGAQLLPVNA